MSWSELIGNKSPSDFCRFQIADLPDGLGFRFYMRLIEASQDVGRLDNCCRKCILQYTKRYKDIFK
jgi:hypothetical protein